MRPSKELLFWPTTPWARETNIRPQQRFVGGDAMRDAQADVPSAKRLRAQLAFKNSMVHGILQFTPSIAFCYVLHRCVSRDIRCRESFVIIKKPRPMSTPRTGHHKISLLKFSFPWHTLCRGLLLRQRHIHHVQKNTSKCASTKHREDQTSA